MHPALTRQHHRPWTIPGREWVWRQSWCDLLFAHWRCPADRLRHLVPEELEIEEFDGSSWVGVVPFRMEGVMRRPLPDLPWISAFPELNFRLYVRYEDRPGVWFVSLDATNRLAIWAARRFFHLPYFHSRIALSFEEGWHVYDSRRLNGDARFIARYRPEAALATSLPGTLEYFLTERYCLYSQSPRGDLYRAEVHHHPWPLQRALAEIEVNELGDSHGISLNGPPETLHFSGRLDTIVWQPYRLAQP